MPNQPIPTKYADLMIADYVSYMQNLGVQMNTQTHSVSFGSKALMAYLNNAMQYADELRIFMGRYPEGHKEAGRTTCILWPYKDGKPAVKPYDGSDNPAPGDGDGEPVDPFNEGSLRP